MNLKKIYNSKLFGVFLFTFTLYILVYPFINLSIQSLYLELYILLSIMSIYILLPQRFNELFSFIIVVFFSGYLFGQTIYFRAFHQYGYISTFFSMRDMLSKFYSSIMEVVELTDIKYLLLPLIFGIIQWKRSYSKHQYRNHYLQSILISLFLLMLSSSSKINFTQYLEDTNTTNNPVLTLQTDYYLYNALPNTNQFVSNFGLVSLAYRELSSYINEPILKDDDINKQITDMLLSKSEPLVNPMSGIFKGKSLLVIEAESLNYFAIDPILTPTLYHLMEYGYKINGYHSPLLTGSTSDIELMINTGLVPTNDGNVVFESYDKNTYPQTLASIFTQNGYYSMASHNNYGIYYNRTEMLPKLGYEFFDAIGLEAYDNVKDSYVIDHIKWIMYESGQYLSYWITFNGHQPYDLASLNKEFIPYYEIVNSTYPDLPEAEKVYLAKNMDLDRGIKQLIIDYKNSKVIDNLVLVLVGDHFPKTLFENETEFISYCENKGYSDDNCFEAPLIIWNNDQFVGEIDKVSSPLDVSTTLYDLFGMEYDYRVSLGHSIFDSSYTGFTFNEYGVISTDHYTFDVLRDTLFHDGMQEEDIYRQEAYDLYQKLQISFNIIETNYFSSNEYKEIIEKNETIN